MYTASSLMVSLSSEELKALHCLHDFAHKQDYQLNSSAFSHCSVWRVAIGKGVLGRNKQRPVQQTSFDEET